MSEIGQIGEAIVSLLGSEIGGRLNKGIQIPDTFPLGIRHLYSWRNGEKWEDMFNPIFDFCLLPFEECLSETKFIHGLYPSSSIVQSSLVIGSHAYGNGIVVAAPLNSGSVVLGNLITEDGAIYGTHDGVIQLMKTTYTAWSEKGDFVEISRRFSSNVGREIKVI